MGTVLCANSVLEAHTPMVDSWLSDIRWSSIQRAVILFIGILMPMMLGGGTSHVSDSAPGFVPNDHPPASLRSTALQSIGASSRNAFDTLRVVSQHVFRETNEIRRERGLSTVTKEETLRAVACAHNGDMFRQDFLEHENPDGELPQDRVMQVHRRLVGGVSENLYGQTQIQREPTALAELMVEKWLNSPPHRKNLLDPYATHLGVCVLQRQNTIRATQVFAKIAAYLSKPFPQEVVSGDALAVSFQQIFPPDASIAQYDFWDPRTERRVSGPTVLTDSVHVPDTTGTLRPRFYILENGQYVIHQGPEITVQAPQ